MPEQVTTRARVGWALFDWANSAYATLIVTFVFSTYFALAVVEDPVRGQQLWGWAASASGLAVALLAPLVGAIVDAGGRRKPWLLAFTALATVATALLWWTQADPAFIAWGMLWYAVGNLGIEFGVVFVNAMLPDLVPRALIGRWSGWAWGLGYAAGIVSMVVALVAFVQADEPWFGLDKASFEHIRAVAPLAAVWLAIFAMPLFLFTPDRPPLGADLGAQVRTGLRALRATLARARQDGNLVRFLIANMITMDGLVTIFVVGGIFAAGVFGMSQTQVLVFGIVLNLTGGIGAALFGWIDDIIGPRRAVLIAIAGLFVTALGAVTAPNATLFWIFGSSLGLFVGPIQSGGRSLMARMAPPGQSTEFFGLFALSGKATAFLGPALVAAVTAATGSQRWGLSVLLLFFVAGGALLWTVREPTSEHL
ncbi:MAG: MFS transporter [Alphaproteobacteria bacterium]|nr:MFS transporter [Alphaproteobacteria bacterium]